MSDPYRKVRPGDPLNFSALVWNSVLDVARPRGGNSGPPGPLTTGRNAAIVRVKNESGSDLSRNSVLGLGDPVFHPDTSEDAFLREVAFRGVLPQAPDHLGKFCVLLEPAPVDRVVRAYVAGVCPVRLVVADDNHNRADVTDDDATALTTATYGSAEILWREGTDEYGYGYGPDPQWALVRLGPPPALVPFRVTSGVAAGSLASPTHFTATLLLDIADGGFTATAAPTTTLGRHFLSVAIGAGANGWAVWAGGYLHPVVWDLC